MYQRMKVMALTQVLGASKFANAVNIYRITMPYTFARKHTTNQFGWCPAGTTDERIMKSDIVVLQRAVTDSAEFARTAIKLFHNNGIKVVYELDDDLTGQYRDVAGGHTCLPYLPIVDLITTSTEGLAEQVKQYTDKPVKVIPNYIDAGSFGSLALQHKRRYGNMLNIMLTGTPTHVTDWEPAYQAAVKITQEYPGVQLLFGGFKPDYAEGIMLQPVDYQFYPSILAEADIVIAAIDPDDRFNHSKSHIKVLESWSAERVLDNKATGGAAVIATDCNVYHDTVGKCGILAQHTEESYYQALKELVENPFRLRQLQRDGLNCVRRKHLIQQHWREWVSAYGGLL